MLAESQAKNLVRRGKFAAADALARFLVYRTEIFLPESSKVIPDEILLNVLRILHLLYAQDRPLNDQRSASDCICFLMAGMVGKVPTGRCRKLVNPFVNLGYLLGSGDFSHPLLRTLRDLELEDQFVIFESARQFDQRLQMPKAILPPMPKKPDDEQLIERINNFFDILELKNLHWSVWREATISLFEGVERKEEFISSMHEMPKAAWRQKIDSSLNGFWQIYSTKNYVPAHDDDKEYDFFISYNSLDEVYAKFVGSLLEANGLKVFAQYKDMPAGSNFIERMDAGLAKSERVIALLSPNYLASSPCRSEWMAAFARDPDSTSGALLPLLIRPCQPTGLLAQIVHLRLLGLQKLEVIEKVLAVAGVKNAPILIDLHWPGESVTAVQELHTSLHRQTPQIRRLILDDEHDEIRFFGRNDVGVETEIRAAESALKAAKTRLQSRVAQYYSSDEGERCSNTDRIIDQLQKELIRNAPDVESFFEELLDARFDLMRMEQSGEIAPVQSRFSVNRVARAIDRSIDSISDAVPQLQRALEQSRRAKISRPDPTVNAALDDLMNEASAVLDPVAAEKLMEISDRVSERSHIDLTDISEGERMLQYQRGGYSVQIHLLSEQASRHEGIADRDRFQSAVEKFKSPMLKIREWMLSWYY